MAMYCSLNDVENCGNDVTCPSGRLMNKFSVVPVSVLMNKLQCTALEPLVSIICVWKAVRWAFGSSTPVKLALGPTNVASITTSPTKTALGKPRVVRAAFAPPPHVRLPSASNSSAIPCWPSAIFHFSSTTQPYKSGCALDPFLMPPPFLGGHASFP